jgi:hypothetical protein
MGDISAIDVVVSDVVVVIVVVVVVVVATAVVSLLFSVTEWTKNISIQP